MGLLKRWGFVRSEPLNCPPPASWIPPRKTCLIASIARTGSNLLCAGMRKTGALGIPTEYFNRSFMKEKHQIHRITAAGQADYAKRAGTTENGVTSIKFLPSQFSDAKKHLRLSMWFPDARWVTTRRKDRLGQAISLVIAHQTGAWTSLNQPVKAPVYSADAILSSLREIECAEDAWDKFFEEQNIQPLQLLYEDIEADLQGCVERVSLFLGEDPSHWRQNTEISDRTVRITKQRGALNEEWRGRFLEESPTSALMKELSQVD